jgi:predicted Zn-dependent peptidase
MKFTLLTSFTMWFSSILSYGAPLVSEETISRQKAATTVQRLSNGIPVIIRNEPSSRIALISIQFDYGLKDAKLGKKSIPTVLFPVMSRATKSYSKEEMNRLQEKFALSMGCSSAVDNSSCAMETVDTYWDSTLPLLGSVVREPLFDPSDIKLIADRSIAQAKKLQSDPEDYVNEIANRVYYESSHPYTNSVADQIKEIPTIGPLELSKAHKEILDASRISIIVVSNLDSKKIIKDMEAQFGSIEANVGYSRTQINYPANQDLGKLAFEVRDIPTSYIRIKFPNPSSTDKDAIATKLLFDILAEEMHTEIRTKRGLSYAAHAMTSQLTIGHGALIVSTPKPKEVVPVILAIIKKIQTKPIPQAQIDEYKKGFATAFFARGETHGSVAGALSNSFYYFNSTNPAYDFPKLLDQVKSKDVMRLAKEHLKDMKVGIIGPQNQFDQDTFKGLP